MIFSEHKFSAEYIAQKVAERSANLKRNTGKSDLLGFGLDVVVQRLDKSPQRYLDYGPYWWALKELLRDAGHAVGDQTDPLVAREYRGVDAVSTLIAADEFRTNYLATNLVGANRFLLEGGSAEWYLLFDLDLEGRVITKYRQ